MYQPLTKRQKRLVEEDKAFTLNRQLITLIKEAYDNGFHDGIAQQNVWLSEEHPVIDAILRKELQGVVRKIKKRK